LPKSHTKKLVATRKPTLAAIASVTPNTGVEIVSRYELHQLSENKFSGVHQVPSTLELKNSSVANSVAI